MSTDADSLLYICRRCGRQLKPGASFCSNCGTPRDKSENKAECTCPKCGQKVGANQRFCSSCGHQLKATVFCENCAKNGLSIALQEGARYCTNCGVSVVVNEGGYRGHHDISAWTNFPQTQAGCGFDAQIFCTLGRGYHLGMHPLLLWNDSLITVIEGAIYVFNLRVSQQRGGTVLPFGFEGGELPKVSLALGVQRHSDVIFPLQLRVVQGMLALPAYESIFLWDIVGNLRGELISEQRGSRLGRTLKLQGTLCADLAVGADRFLAALVRTESEVWLNVYELVGNAVTLFCKWSLGALPCGFHTIYINRHYAYVLSQSELHEGGDLRGFSLDNGRSLDLDAYKSRCLSLLCLDNEAELFYLLDRDGVGQLVRFRPDTPYPDLFINEVVLPQYCRREGAGFWVTGRSLHFSNGQRTLRFDGLDEQGLCMAFPPLRSPLGLIFVDDQYSLAALRKAQNLPPCSIKFPIYVGGRTVRLNRLSPWIARGGYLYGFGDAGILSIDFTRLHAAGK